MSWYTNRGADTDVVLSARCRLARNVDGLPFGGRLGDDDARRVIATAGDTLGSTYDRIDFDKITPLVANAYLDEHIVSMKLLGAKSPRSLYKNDKNGTYIMVPEEDHFRIQCILRGNAAEEAYRRAAEAECAIAKAFPLAFDKKLGYLTRCPTNLGTAMRISLMMFLPAIQKYGQIPSLTENLQKLGFTIRGTYGEGSEVEGCLYQISNCITLGQDEGETVASLRKLADYIISEERRLRKKMLSADTIDEVTDAISRAYGTLAYAHMMSKREFLPLWVNVRLGVSLAELAGAPVDAPKYETLDTLLIEAQPSVLMLMYGGAITSAADRDIKRAALIRNRLS